MQTDMLSSLRGSTTHLNQANDPKVGKTNGFSATHQPGTVTIPQTFFNPEETNGISPQVVVVMTSNGKKDEPINEEFIKNLNESYGENLKEQASKAWNFLSEMRKQAGLDGTSTAANIPNARKGLCLLTTVSSTQDNKLKEAAFDSLAEVLRLDPLTKASAPGLITLAMDLMKQLDRDLSQQQTLDIQRKVACTYGLVAELILRHYALGHINGMTEELKLLLEKAPINLNNLNTQDDPFLDFEASFSLDGCKRFKSDANSFIDVLKRLGLVIDGIGKIYNKDFATGISSLVAACKDLDLKVRFPWYEFSYIVNSLAKKAQKNSKDEIDFERFQAFYNENYQQLLTSDWKFKFTYSYVQALGWLASSAAHPNVRKRAFGLLEEFHKCDKFKSEYTLLNAVKRLEKPKKIENNFVIQSCCVRSAMKLAVDSMDHEIKLRSRQLINSRLAYEESQVLDAQEKALSQPKEKNSILKKIKGPKIEEERDMTLKLRHELIEELKTVIPENKEDKARWFTEKHELLSKAATNTNGVQNSSDKISGLKPHQAISTAPETKAESTSIKTGEIHITPKTSSRELSPIIKRVAQCVKGITVENLSVNVRTTGTALQEGNGLRFSNETLEQIIVLLTKDHSITKLDLTKVFLDNSQIKMVAEALPKTGITNLTLDTAYLEELKPAMDKPSATALAVALKQKIDLQISMTSPMGYAEIGVELKKMDLFDLAKEYYTVAIKTWPKDPQTAHAYARRGNVFSAERAFLEAESDANKAWELNKTCFLALSVLMTINVSQEKRIEAFKYAQIRYLAEGPTVDNTYNLAARIYDCTPPTDKEGLRNSLKYVQECLKLNPNDKPALDLNSRILKKLEN